MGRNAKKRTQKRYVGVVVLKKNNVKKTVGVKFMEPL